MSGVRTCEGKAENSTEVRRSGKDEIGKAKEKRRIEWRRTASEWYRIELNGEG